MGNVDELERQAEEAKDRIKRDIADIKDVLIKMAAEAGGRGKTKVEGTMQRVERRIEGMTRWVETRIEKAVVMITESSANPGSKITREMDFSDFTGVEVDCAFKVEITRSDSYRVAITASEKLFEHITVIKSGNTLKVSLKPFHFHMRPTLETQITMPTLSKLRLAAATKGIVRGFSSQECFALNLSGASSLNLDMEAGEAKFEIAGASKVNGRMKVDDVEFTLSGASGVELSGSGNNANLSAWGASKLNLADFILNDTSVHLKSASRAVINANGKLDLDLSGASRLSYVGNPVLHDVNLSGAATLSRR